MSTDRISPIAAELAIEHVQAEHAQAEHPQTMVIHRVSVRAGGRDYYVTVAHGAAVTMVRIPRGAVKRRLRETDLLRALADASQPLSGSRSSLRQPAPIRTAPRMTGLLRLAARMLPVGERDDWLEEQRGYLADLPTLQERWVWIVAQLAAMPRYAYTVRTGRQKGLA